MKYPWLLLALLAVSMSAGAREMYSWTDANGVKHFSDSPPPRNASQAKKLKVAGGITSAQAAEETQADDEKGSGQSMAAAAGYTAEEITRNCETARRNHTMLESQAPRASDNGEDPSTEAVARHQAQIDKANQQIKLFCH